mgnify:CR=1 FL=1
MAELSLDPSVIDSVLSFASRQLGPGLVGLALCDEHGRTLAAHSGGVGSLAELATLHSQMAAVLGTSSLDIGNGDDTLIGLSGQQMAAVITLADGIQGILTVDSAKVPQGVLLAVVIPEIKRLCRAGVA